MNDELYHHGIKGMKWGVRRYQNQDGSLTTAGKKRYSLSKAVKNTKIARKMAKRSKARKEAKRERKAINKRIKSIDKAQRKRAIDTDIGLLNDQQLRNLNDRIRNENAYKDSIRLRKKKIFGVSFASDVLKRNGSKIVDKLVYTGAAGLGVYAATQMFGKDFGTTVSETLFSKKKKSNN